MNVNIRPARPEDAEFLAWVMLAAGRSHMERGIWDIIISQPEEKCLAVLKELSLAPPRHMCSYTEFLVAEVDGRAVAALEGYDPDTNGELTVTEPLATATQKVGLTEADMAAGEQGLAAFLTCHLDTVEGAWVVEHVATLPDFRRQGVITRLLEAILDKGRQQGFGRAQVTFYIGNTPAERAYQKVGFRFLDEKRHPDFEAEIGCPGMTRWLCDL
ncbi:MAG: GNAT family N-acetyltransferase [Chloroflexi bacterium]|nr:MAG: GNAT family N-acetyltransferase [Chloroflexota bacterium]RLC96527.1 MAG: GNAT family N-acetyltransferase [Chloroflexota bacterium]